MGQISLPRLEKINTTMHWESGFLFKQENWASPKLFILNKLLLRYFFKYTFLKKKHSWYGNKNKQYAHSFIHKKVLKVIKKKKLNAGPFDFMDSYIYCWDNKYYTLVIYSLRKIKSVKKYVTNKCFH